MGLATCLYRAEAADGRFPSRLAALGTDWHFLPNAALGEAMGRARGCYGATMALRRDVLDRIGGFAPLADLLADDHALGEAVRRLGLRVVVAPALPVHMAHEAGLRDLLAHELRWARTLRLLAPSGYLGMGVTHPLAWGLLAAAAAPGPWGAAALAAALIARFGLAVAVDRATGAAGGLRRVALLPLRDLLSFAIWAAGLARSPVVWGGRRYRLRRDGSMVELRPRGMRRSDRTMMRTLFLQAPSFDGFDGGAGSRYQARREIKSFWFPTWLAQPAALVEGSRLVDAPPHRQGLAEVAAMARGFDLAVLHTSTPSFASDVKVAERLKAENPSLKVGLIGAKVAVQAEE